MLMLTMTQMLTLMPMLAQTLVLTLMLKLTQMLTLTNRNPPTSCPGEELATLWPLKSACDWGTPGSGPRQV